MTSTSAARSYDWAALQMREFTELVAAHLPNAAIGANFAPADFCSESWKWIDVFRASALTMPWSEGCASRVLTSSVCPLFLAMRLQMHKSDTSDTARILRQTPSPLMARCSVLRR
jgi:hypothetical protein